MSDHITKADEAGAAFVREVLARPLPESPDMLGIEGEFDPWDIFPTLYGSYCSSFDQCALDVLSEIRDGHRKREDLGADMLREMLCTSNLCDYGTSPRVCFPTQQFSELLPALIEKWRTYAILAWGDDFNSQ